MDLCFHWFIYQIFGITCDTTYMRSFSCFSKKDFNVFSNLEIQFFPTCRSFITMKLISFLKSKGRTLAMTSIQPTKRMTFNGKSVKQFAFKVLEFLFCERKMKKILKKNYTNIFVCKEKKKMCKKCQSWQKLFSWKLLIIMQRHSGMCTKTHTHTYTHTCIVIQKYL